MRLGWLQASTATRAVELAECHAHGCAAWLIPFANARSSQTRAREPRRVPRLFQLQTASMASAADSTAISSKHDLSSSPTLVCCHRTCGAGCHAQKTQRGHPARQPTTCFAAVNVCSTALGQRQSHSSPQTLAPSGRASIRDAGPALVAPRLGAVVLDGVQPMGTPSNRDAVTPDGDGTRDAEHAADADALVQAVEALVARHVVGVEALQAAVHG